MVGVAAWHGGRGRRGALAVLLILAVVLLALGRAAGASAELGATWYPGGSFGSTYWGIGPAMAYDDAARAVMLYYPTYTNAPSPTITCSALWRGDGASWDLVPAACTDPPPRAGAAMAYDAAHGRLVLFGGNLGAQGVTDETWTWDGTSWSQATPPTRPPAREEASATYDPQRREVLLFGGYGTGGALGDTWAWDGASWAELATGGAAAPSARRDAGLTYDAARGRAVLFGGCCQPSDGELADTWTWDGASWTQEHPSTAPAPASDGLALLAYDDAAGLVVLVGGAPGTETWTWDGRAWARQNPVRSPPGGGGAIAYDAAHGRVVLFGLAQSEAHYNTYYTWMLGLVPYRLRLPFVRKNAEITDPYPRPG